MYLAASGSVLVPRPLTACWGSRGVPGRVGCRGAFYGRRKPILSGFDASIKLLAERRLGELLAAMPKRANQHAAGNTMLPALEDFGITKTQSSRWQKQASAEHATGFDVAGRPAEVSGTNGSGRGRRPPTACWPEKVILCPLGQRGR